MLSCETTGLSRSMRALIVDDEAGVRGLVSRVVKRAGGSCGMAATAEEAIERLAREPFDIALLDLVLPGMDGLRLAHLIHERYPDVSLIMITGSAEFQTALSAMQAGAVDYVVKPFEIDTLLGAYERAVTHRRIRMQAARAYGLQQAITERTLEIQMLFARSGESADSLVKGFTAALALRSHEMASHSERVAELAGQIGLVLELEASDVEALRRTALLHDIGKLTLPATLLGKSDALTDDEIAIVRRHPELGYQVVSQVPVLSACADSILGQLEWYDGTGWPQGLRGAQIPLSARILSVANVYDVMTHPRPCGVLKAERQALEEIDSCAGTQFDPRVVRAFFAVRGY